MRQRFLIIFGIACLFLGSLVFLGHSSLGIMVDVLQGVLYVASGLFAFAAVMIGPEAMKRFVLWSALVYGVIFFAGVANQQGLVLRLFRVNAVENVIHLIFVLALVSVYIGEQALARWQASSKSTA